MKGWGRSGMRQYPGRIECRPCDLPFETMEKLREHQEDHHGVKFLTGQTE